MISLQTVNHFFNPESQTVIISAIILLVRRQAHNLLQYSKGASPTSRYVYGDS